MKSPMRFELSHSEIWNNNPRIEDINRCLSILSILYANIERETNQVSDTTFTFLLGGISKGMKATEICSVPQITLARNYKIRICLRHEKQVAFISIAHGIDLSILGTAIFYYMEYYEHKYQSLQDHKNKILEERRNLVEKKGKAEAEVTRLRQREILEDDDLLTEALNQVHDIGEEFKKNGVDLYEIDQVIGRLVRFKEV